MADAPSAKELDATLQLLNQSAQAQLTIAKNIEKVIKAQKGETAEVQRTNDALAEAVKEIGDFKKSVDETEKIVDGLADKVDAAAWKNNSYKNVKKYKDELGKAKILLNKMKNIPITDKKTFKEVQNEYKKQLGTIGALQLGIEGAGKITGRTMKGMGESVSAVGNMFGSIGRKSPRDLKAAAMAGKGVAVEMGAWADTMKGMPGLLGKAGKAIGGVSEALGGVSEFMAGPAGWAMIIGKAIVDIEFKANKFITDQNKIFAQMRGPDIMTGDVEKQFKDFNNQVFDMGRNLKAGLNAKQVQEFFENINASGMAVGKLNTDMQSYRDVLDVAAKSSRTWGTNVDYMGQQQADLMMNYGADLQSVDKIFNQVGFDAGKTSLTADKFWTVIKNTTASMGFYGIAIKGLSGTLAKWNKDAIGGANDQAAAIQNLGDIFKKTGTEAIQYVQLALKGGGPGFWKDIIRQEMAKAEDAEKTATGAKRKQIADQIKRFQDMMGMNDKDLSVAVMNNFGEFQDQAQKIIKAALVGAAGGKKFTDLNGETYTAILAFGKSIGLADSTIRTLVTSMNGAYDELDDFSKLTLKPLSISDEFDPLLKEMDSMFKDLGSEDKQTQEAAVDKLTKQLMAAGMTDKGLAEDMAKMATTSQDLRDAIADQIVPVLGKKAGRSPKSMVGVLQGIKKDTVKFQKADEARSTLSGKTDADIADAAQSTSDKIKQGTLSWDDMVKIGTDQVSWSAANLTGSMEINKGVNGILDLLTDHWGASKQKQANLESAYPVVGALLKNRDQLKDVHSALGNLSDNFADHVNALNKTLTESQTDLSNIRESMKSAPGGIPDKNAIQNAIATTKKVMGALPGDTALGKELDTYLQGLQKLQKGYEITDKDTREQLMRDQEKVVEGLATDIDQTMSGTIRDAAKVSSQAPPAKITPKGPTTPMMFANMREPQRITSPGMVKLDPGEIIQPGNFARTTLATVPASPGMPDNAGLGGKNISINVNAVEKDLATRIANEIRAVLYKERVV